jgi:type I restriction-modification system DNA methylase subunit
MNTAVHHKLVSFIWSIADDCLRDVYVRGKYLDIIFDFILSNPPYGKSWGIEQKYIKDVIDSCFDIKLKSYRGEEEDADAIEEVTAGILALKNESDGLILEILNHA